MTAVQLVAAIQVNGGKMATSPDGAAWTEGSSIAATFEGYVVTSMDSSWWLIAGLTSGANAVYKSGDGLAWSLVTTGLSSDSFCYGAAIKFGTKYCLGAGATTATSDLFRTSPDLTTWSSPSTLNAGFADTSTSGIFGAATDGTTLVLVGQTSTNVPQITHSTDAITFTNAVLPVVGSGTMRGAAYGNGVWVACGATDVSDFWSSVDGHTWTSSTEPVGWTGNATCVWFSQDLNQFCAVGSTGKIATSPDGTTWTLQTSPFGASEVYRVVWSVTLALWVAVADAQQVATSPDGVTWTSQTPSWGGGTYATGIGALIETPVATTSALNAAFFPGLSNTA